MAIKKLAVLALIIPMLSLGCAGMIGKSEPVFHPGEDGSVIVAHKVTGVSGAFGDGGVGQNVEGGNVSKSASELLGGIFDAAIRTVSAVFGGFGAVGAAMQPAPEPPQPDFEESEGF